MMHPIQNPNTSGQGYSQASQEHPLCSVAIAHGYTYSHSTPLGDRRDPVNLLHTFKQGPHNVSFSTLKSGTHSRNWQTSTSCASGRRHQGNGDADLSKHLTSKARRYNLANLTA